MFTNCNSSLQTLFCNGYKTFAIIIHITDKNGLWQVTMKAIDIHLNYSKTAVKVMLHGTIFNDNF